MRILLSALFGCWASCLWIAAGGATLSARSAQAGVQSASPQLTETLQKLRGLAGREVTLTSDQFEETILPALGHPGAAVRKLALEMVSLKVSGIQSAGRSTSFPAPQDREVIQRLFPKAVALLRDGDVGVRAEAASAVFALDFNNREASEKPRLRDETAKVLAAAYEAEQEPQVRSRIMHAVASIDEAIAGESKETGNRLVVLGLSDPNKSVLAIALRGVGRRKITPALAEVATLLAHEAREVRMAAADCLATFRGLAKPHLGSLRSALSVEKDESAAGFMQRAIRIIEEAR
jgi:hypothetical protein